MIINQFKNVDEALDVLYPDTIYNNGDSEPQGLRIDAHFLPKDVKDHCFKNSKTLEIFKNKIEKAIREKNNEIDASNKAYDMALDAYEKQQDDLIYMNECRNIATFVNSL